MTPHELQALLRSNPDVTVDGDAPDAFADINEALFGDAGEPARKLSEEEAQQLVIRWADAHVDEWPELRWLHHSPNGGYRHKATAARLKSMGCRRGYPDLVLNIRRGCYTGMALELKVGRNKPTEAQLEWIDHLARQGWFCCVE